MANYCFGIGGAHVAQCVTRSSSHRCRHHHGHPVGNRARGRMLLAQALHIEPRHETAWLWMASLAETPERQRECLERVLAINPNNEAAHRALRLLSEPHRQAVIPDQAIHSLPTSTLRQAQTAMQAEGTSQNPALHCPQCGAPIETIDKVCAFCQSLVQSPSASSAPSYSKRTPLTRGEQRDLTRRGLWRHGASHLFNTTTIVGIVITGGTVAVILWTIQQNYLWMIPWMIQQNQTVPGELIFLSLLSLLPPLLFLVPGIVNLI